MSNASRRSCWSPDLLFFNVSIPWNHRWRYIIRMKEYPSQKIPSMIIPSLSFSMHPSVWSRPSLKRSAIRFSVCRPHQKQTTNYWKSVLPTFFCHYQSIRRFFARWQSLPSFSTLKSLLFGSQFIYQPAAPTTLYWHFAESATCLSLTVSHSNCHEIKHISPFFHQLQKSAIQRTLLYIALVYSTSIIVPADFNYYQSIRSFGPISRVCRPC